MRDLVYPVFTIGEDGAQRGRPRSERADAAWWGRLDGNLLIPAMATSEATPASYDAAVVIIDSDYPPRLMRADGPSLVINRRRYRYIRSCQSLEHTSDGRRGFLVEDRR